MRSPQCRSIPWSNSRRNSEDGHRVDFYWLLSEAWVLPRSLFVTILEVLPCISYKSCMVGDVGEISRSWSDKVLSSPPPSLICSQGVCEMVVRSLHQILILLLKETTPLRWAFIQNQNTHMKYSYHIQNSHKKLACDYLNSAFAIWKWVHGAVLRSRHMRYHSTGSTIEINAENRFPNTWKRIFRCGCGLFEPISILMAFIFGHSNPSISMFQQTPPKYVWHLLISNSYIWNIWSSYFLSSIILIFTGIWTG